MGKSELGTKATGMGVADFIAAVPDARRREEASVIDAMHRRVTGLEDVVVLAAARRRHREAVAVLESHDGR